MQTVSSLAERLDMSPEEAVETLRYMLFDVEGVDSQIDDEQCDLLIDIDDDRSIADKFREKKLKEQEKAKARAKKAAAKKKTAAKKKAKADEEKKEVAEILPPELPVEPEKPSEISPAAEIIAHEESAAEAPTEVQHAPPAEVTQPTQKEGTPETADKKAHVELPAEPTEPEPVAKAETPESEAKPVEPRPEKKAKPQKKKSAEKVKSTIQIGAAAEKEEPAIRILRADGTAIDTPETAELPSEEIETEEETEEPETGLLAEAERQQEEEEERRVREAARSTVKPDPAVVAEVKRKAAERMQQKARKSIEERSGAPTAPAPAPKPKHKTSADRAGQSDDSRKSKRAVRSGPTGKTARKRIKKAERARNEEAMRREAAAAVREFQAGGAGPKRKKRRRDRDGDSGDAEKSMQPAVIQVDETLTVEELAEQMDVPVNDLILELMDYNIMATKNQALDINLIRKICEPQGFEVESIIPEEEELLTEEPDEPTDLVPRAPVITVMGHVDHGKTSLLDFVRKASVADGEVGGITQHIAAYEAQVNNGRVVFLDTPGHEAFTQMRARGAQATDVVVLVVAADDGIMPQTVEAIDHAKSAEVPIVVAVNKCDKPDAQPDRLRQELTQYELVPEEWGGQTIMKNISAKFGDGVDELMELLALEADLLELKANPKKSARGVVIESEISRGQGPVAWVLVQTGTLRAGDVYLAGTAYGRVRAMYNSRMETVEEAGPSTPVLVTGFSEPPDAGDQFHVVPDERIARSIAGKRADVARHRQEATAKHMTLEDFHERMLAGGKNELPIVIKADVQGSVEVLQSSLSKLGNEEVLTRVVHSGVGSINESDVLLASASDAVIVGYHVSPNPRAARLAEQEGVDIRTYQIIYEAIDDVRKALEGMLTPETREVVIGHVEIRQVFRSSALGNIAGCYVRDGEVTRNSRVRVIRNDETIFDGKIGTLRRLKDDVRSVQSGYECGIKIEGFDDIEEGDIIEAYRVESVAKTLA